MNSFLIEKSDIFFHDRLSDMPINQLTTEITDDIFNSYGIVILNINKVLNHIYDGQAYQKFEMDNKMIGLIEFVKNDNKLIPPIIRNIDKNSWAIIDGQHRLALFIHLGITNIPFLIRNDQMKLSVNLQ
jgi:hypothetical protein